MPTTTRPKARAATFTLMSPPVSVQGSLYGATVPQPPVLDRGAKQAERLDRFNQRVQKILRRWKVKAKLTSRYPAIVRQSFTKNGSDVACAQDLVDAQKAADKAKKKWWKARPKTDADDRIARKFAQCKVMPMFKE